MSVLFIDEWGQRWRQTTKLRQGDASGKRGEVDGGERWTEKSRVFSSVAQRWCSLRAAARVQRSVPLRHSEPLSVRFSEELRAAPAGPRSARFSHVRALTIRHSGVEWMLGNFEHFFFFSLPSFYFPK